MPTISIIIPVYNVEKYLRPCLDSVLNQTFTDFEAICVDDCSTDGSYSILREYAQKDSRVKVLKNSVNLRAAGTRNVGIENSVGDYLYFLDADDYIDSGYLEEMLASSEKTGADIVMNLSIRTETNGQVYKYVHPSMPTILQSGEFFDSATAIDKSFCVVWMRLFKRSFIEKNKIRFQPVNMTEDYVFHYITNLYASSVFAFNGNSSYHYVLRDDSVTGIVKINNQRDYLTMKASDLVFDYLYSHDLLAQNKAKLFNVSGFFKVDTQEKFELYHSYFKKVYPFLASRRDMYNPMDLFFADSILSCDCLEDYLIKYSANVAMGFVKNKNRK